MARDEVVLRVTGDSGGLTRAFKDADKQAVASMAKIEASVRSANSKMAQSIDTGSGKIGKLKASVSEHAAALAIAEREQIRLTGRYGEGSVQADKAALAVQRLTAAHAFNAAELARATAVPAGPTGLAAMSAAAASFGRKMQSAGGSMRDAGRSMTRNLSLPLMAVGALGIKTAMDYEKSMNILKQASSASEGEMASLASLAKTLGADLTLPGTSAADAAMAMTELAKAGLDVGEIMGATKGVLQLSAAGGLDNATSATVAANALNAFGLKGAEATRIADLLAGAANGSSAEVGQLADSLSQGASVFAQAGIPIEDFVTSAALLANVGIKGSDAGTSLKSMLLKLQSPSKEAAKTMADLGISLYDAQGRMKPFSSIIETFSTAMGGLTQEQRDMALGAIFGSDAIRSANGVLLAGLPAFNKMKGVTTQQGAAAAAAAAKNKGLAGAIDAIKSSMETLAINVFAPALTALAGFAIQVAELGSKFSSLPGPVKTAIFVFGGILAVAGPLAWIVGALTTVLGALAAVMAFVLTPIGAIGLALAAVGVAVFLAYQKFETFRNVVQAVFGAVSLAATTFFNVFTAAITTGVSVIQAIWSGLWGGFGGIVEGVFDGVVGYVTAAMNAVIKVINTLIGAYNKLPFAPNIGKISEVGAEKPAPKVITAPLGQSTGTMGDFLGSTTGNALLGPRPTMTAASGGTSGTTVNNTTNITGVSGEEAMERAKREAGWRMALMGQR